MGAFQSRRNTLTTPDEFGPFEAKVDLVITRKWVCCGLLPWSVTDTSRMVATERFTEEAHRQSRTVKRRRLPA